MSALRQLQENFQAYLLGDATRMQDQVLPSRRVSAEQRLAIYAEAYRLRLLEAMEDDFPALLEFIGRKAFRETGSAYIDAHPSQHFSIRYFGQHLVRFLEPEDHHKQKSILSELAAFEWALGEALDAANARHLQKAELDGLTPAQWSTLQFDLHPSVRLVTLAWNAPAIRQAHDKGEPLPESQANEAPITWLIWRKELFSHYRSLPPPEASALTALSEGKDFAQLCEGLCDYMEHTQVADRAAGMLTLWLSDGLLTEYRTG